MYCPNCMRYNKDENVIKCEYCNEPMNIQNNTFQLPVGTILAGRYYVGKVLGQGGFGITYVGCDLKINMKIAIKEYYPQGVVGRISTYNLGLTVNTEIQKTIFAAQKDRFMEEARILAEFSSDIHIVRVSDIFEENNTAYIVMEYVEGVTLDNYCKQHGKMSFDVIWNMFSPLVITLSEIHDKGLIHRDISPANIMLNKKAGIKLIDFGAARDFSMSDEKSLSIVLKHGYAPPEQYSGHGQGPWTDVYALCTTMYRAITGVVPMNSIERITDDSLKHPSDMGAVIKPEQEAVLMSGLAVKKEDRIQSMRELDKAIKMANNGAVTERAKKYCKVLRASLENEHSNKNISNSNSVSKVVSNTPLTLQTHSKYLKQKNDQKENKFQHTRIKEEQNIECHKHSNMENKNRIVIVSIVVGVATICAVVFIVIFIVRSPSNKYKNALSLMGNGEYEKAITAFEVLNGYKDSDEMIEACLDILKEIEYNKALFFIDNKMYYKAIDILESLDGYRESNKKISTCEKSIQSSSENEIIKSIVVGQEIYFGDYEQVRNQVNGKEPIKWIVLKIDNGKALLISKYALNCNQYHDKNENVKWDDCFLRKWLNRRFIYEAFSMDQQKLILKSQVTDNGNPQFNIEPGIDTSDKIFLLSTEEAEQLFPSRESRQCAPTNYAKIHGAFVGNNGNALWFLRTSGSTNNRVAYVNTGGKVDYKGTCVVSRDFCIRPAMWIEIGE